MENLLYTVSVEGIVLLLVNDKSSRKMELSYIPPYPI